MTGRGSRLHSRPRAQCACAERALPGLWGCPGRPRPSRRPHLQPVPGPRRRHRSLSRRGGHGAGWWLFLLRAPHRRAFGHRRKRRRDGGRGRTKPQDARAKTAGEAPETLPRGTRQAALGQEGPGPRGRLRAGRVPVTAQAASPYSYGTAQAASPRGPRPRHRAGRVPVTAQPTSPRWLRHHVGRVPVRCVNAQAAPHRCASRVTVRPRHRAWSRCNTARLSTHRKTKGTPKPRPAGSSCNEVATRPGGREGRWAQASPRGTHGPEAAPRPTGRAPGAGALPGVRRGPCWSLAGQP